MRRRFKALGIYRKLLITHAAIAAVFILSFAILLSSVYASLIARENQAAVRSVNRHIAQNVDTFFYSLIKLSEAPYYSRIVRAAMESGDADFAGPSNINDATTALFVQMFLSNNNIDSIYLSSEKLRRDFSRGYDSNYVYDLRSEPWYQDIYDARGVVKVIGPHPKYINREDSALVISVARSIVKPFSLEHLGMLAVNIRPDALDSVFRQAPGGVGSNIYLIDPYGIIAYSGERSDIGRPFAGMFPHGTEIVDGGKVKIGGTTYLIDEDNFCRTGFTVFSLTPMSQIYRGLSVVVLLCALIGFALMLLSCYTAFRISKTITGALLRLSEGIARIDAGDIDIRMLPESADEIGELTVTFNLMLDSIQSLMANMLDNQEKKHKAEMLALQSQIKPHFIYNSLNVIKSMAELQGSDGIADALSELSGIFVYCSQAGEEVPLHDELRFTERYLSIMRLRYFNRFSAEVKTEPGTENCRVLRFLFQPFIENAILHGFRKQDSTDNKIELHIRREGDGLIALIQDNGEGIANAALLKSINEGNIDGLNSIGMANVIERIAMRYGKPYGVRIESSPGKGVAVTLRLPVLTEAE